MIPLLVIPAIVIAAFAHGMLKVYAPSNVLTRRVRSSRPTIGTFTVLLLLAIGCIALAHQVGQALDAGAPRWLNVMVLVLAWDAIKFGALACLTAARGAVRLRRADGIL